jgi:hypothetical protein
VSDVYVAQNKSLYDACMEETTIKNIININSKTPSEAILGSLLIITTYSITVVDT